ncbi:prevent-host-death family protein [Microvirgula sp. AG722]|uniref:Antitoxin n=1 Tax=Microvirgula aerodenitrificans TaxID=57480 RepID=A0A2S0PCF6_9NEIS|nr:MULTISPECIES: type II toxin-antitoxin system prevent-host-death family antitoxin [Microvirgula]AVY95025.1 type II toxin-antitoxin system prevent-host-death family antitoxin [Microvirgula aerodenitrificans]RAS15912.1 prevent-host-death family protein [Microvirgula sp. AG722]
MSTTALAEAKNHLSRLVDEAVAGREVIISRHGRPVARLVAIDHCTAPRFGALKGRLDIPDDFDQPLSDAELALFTGTD